MYAQNKNITYIKDLPDLDDLEGGSQQHEPPSGMPDKFMKFIRPSMAPAVAESGMYTQGPSDFQQQEEAGPSMMPIVREGFTPTPIENTPSCLDIYSHIENCPICSRHYKRDNSIFIIAIIILSIICILLLKKVLNL